MDDVGLARELLVRASWAPTEAWARFMGSFHPDGPGDRGRGLGRDAELDDVIQEIFYRLFARIGTPAIDSEQSDDFGAAQRAGFADGASHGLNATRSSENYGPQPPGSRLNLEVGSHQDERRFPVAGTQTGENGEPWNPGQLVRRDHQIEWPFVAIHDRSGHGLQHFAAVSDFLDVVPI